MFKIAIVGAGPAGCMLARLLTYRGQNISVTIFEGEDSINFRSQGGTLDLHTKTGQRALREAGLYDEFFKFARFDSEAITMADKNFLCYIKLNGNKDGSTTGRPEIDRYQLRKLLYESLPQGIVQWGHKLARVDSDLTLHFANKPSQDGFDLIVGADGGWSKVRSLVTNVKPFYSGIAGHSMSIPDAEQNAPDLYKLVNRGSLFSWSDGKSLIGQQLGDGSINVATWSIRPQNWQKECGYDVHDGKATKAACLREYAGWDPRLVAFTQQAEDHVVPRDLYMLPIEHRWQNVKGVTLVGDAAHLSTPFAGEGVNIALADCVELAEAIVSANSAAELHENVQAFEESMFPRAQKTKQKTWDNLQSIMMVPDSPRNGIERFLINSLEDEMGRWLMMLVTPVVYAYFFVFKLIW